MDEIMLTVIMSNYNQEKYIRKAIDSVLSQKVNFKYKLIITDDLSQKDNSVQIIKEYAEKYPDIIHPLYNKENGGYLVNILRAKEITKTPYFCLLDADDYYTDQKFLQRAYDFLQNNSEYVIYYENVNYLYEDGAEKPFIAKNVKSSSYDLNDYLQEKVPIVQTTGQFFRNVIFSKGIPEIMKNAVGTDSERSFEGDYDRFIMHLKYGKAFYNNKICGIYRIQNSGIFSNLSEARRRLFQLQTFYDYNRYFENKYFSFFLSRMYEQLLYFIKNLKSLNTLDLSEHEFIQFCKLYNILMENKELIPMEKLENQYKDTLIKKIKRTIKHIIRR